jgi:predicted nucleotidyltransferase
MSDRKTIYTIEELKTYVAPIAKRYRLSSVYLFGSYARGEATSESDVDMLIDRTDSSIRSLFDMGALYNDLGVSLGKEIDLVTTDAIGQEDVKRRTPLFLDKMDREKVRIYERQR